jgi:4-hydroxyphenylacetate 3-monooxygenase
MPTAPLLQAQNAEERVEGPYTGREYLDSIKSDGREVWLRGERISDVTTHPAFRNSARMVARLYDAMHRPESRDKFMVAFVGGPGWAHAAYQAPRTLADNIRAGNAIAEGARLTYGWMGRSPDFVGAYFGATFGVHAALCGEYEDNARRLYDRMRRRAPHLGHAIVNPPVDRFLVDKANDVMLAVEKETDAGLIVSGAKVVATGTVLSQEVVIGHTKLPDQSRKYTAAFVIPVATPGLKLICRRSYEQDAAATATPFDAPLSSRLDENDSILVLERVLVPWENVLLYSDNGTTLPGLPGASARMLMHGCIRLAVKLDFISGLFIKAVEITGTKDFRGVQAGVGEVIAFRQALWAFVEAITRDVVAWGDGFVQPRDEHTQAYRALAGEYYSKMRALILAHVASGLIYLPSDAADFRNPATRCLLDRYARGSYGIDAERRAKTLKLLWDAVGSEFGSRHELYELNYSGSQEQIRADQYVRSMKSGLGDQLVGFAESCMSEYDLNGWTANDLEN